jgi:hypothetical protein
MHHTPATDLKAILVEFTMVIFRVATTQPTTVQPPTPSAQLHFTMMTPVQMAGILMMTTTTRSTVMMAELPSSYLAFHQMHWTTSWAKTV